MTHDQNPLNDPDLLRLLASPGPLRLEPTRLRWSLGFIAHAAIVTLCFFALRDGYMESPMARIGLLIAALSLPFTLAHALRWRCYVEVDHSGIRQVIAGWERRYEWPDLSDFSTRDVQGRTYVIFKQQVGKRTRERSIGLTYGMKPDVLARFLHIKHQLLRQAAGSESATSQVA